MHGTDLMEKVGLDLLDAPTSTFIRQAAEAMSDRDNNINAIWHAGSMRSRQYSLRRSLGQTGSTLSEYGGLIRSDRCIPRHQCRVDRFEQNRLCNCARQCPWPVRQLAAGMAAGHSDVVQNARSCKSVYKLGNKQSLYEAGCRQRGLANMHPGQAQIAVLKSGLSVCCTFCGHDLAEHQFGKSEATNR